MQDEARHVTFGRMALRDYYPHLTQAERDEREEFCVEACYRLRDRFQANEVWETLGVPAEVRQRAGDSPNVRRFRSYLFSRIVPILRDIGLWGPTIQRGFDQMGILDYASTDVDAVMAEDEAIAEALDAERLQHIEQVAAAAS